MNCDTFHHLLDAWLDHELDGTASSAMQVHHDDCLACREEAAMRRDVDQLLRSRLEWDPAITTRICEQVSRQLPWQQRQAPHRHVWRGVLPALLAAAAGFLIACVALPWMQDDRMMDAQPPGSLARASTGATAPLVARLAPSTQSLQVVYHAAAGGEPSAEQNGHSPARHEIVMGAQLITDAKEPCELYMVDGPLLRLDGNSDLTMKAADTVALQSGRLWCSTNAEGTPLVIETPTVEVTVFDATCDVAVTEESTNVLAVDGSPQVRPTSGKAIQVQPGQLVRFEHHGAATTETLDPLLATSWIHPVLLKRGTSDPELTRRVAEIWDKVQPQSPPNAYECELRAIGVGCSEPLMTFLCPTGASAERGGSATDEARRERAANLLADLAGFDSASKLVQLLEDHNPRVRAHAARGLSRLSGHSFGFSPEDWQRMPSDQRLAAVRLWQRWLENPLDVPSQAPFPPKKAASPRPTDALRS